MNSNSSDSVSAEAPLLSGSDGSEGPGKDISPSVERRLYISHFLSTCNSRVFEFGAVLYLASIFPNTLLPMSVYALARGASAIVFSPAIGHYIDTGERLQVVRLSVVLQRIAVAASCVVFWILATEETSGSASKSWLMALLTVLACVEKLCAIMNLISVERDWVVIIAQGSEPSLRALNAQMRRIDLICKLAGPFFIALIDGVSTQVAILVNLGMNLLSISVEYYAIAKVYQMVPALHAPNRSTVEDTGASDAQRGRRCLRARLTVLRDLKFYFRHRAFLPSFSCALLYFTVLSFSGQMVTYLLSIGYNSFHIGIARTVSVAFEISATWIAPAVMSKIGPIRAGIWFLSWQMLSLAAAASGFWEIRSEIMAATCLVCGSISSRVGLWGFDLSAQIIVQEEVEPDHRGSFSSMEASWQSTFELCSYATTIIFSRPEQFQWPVLMSCVAVFTGGGLYTMFVRSRRGHLFHLPQCIEPKRRGSVPPGLRYERLA
ncbi:hypothetical protein D8B26_001365 [Coccidioides posadasii str. Silveira]|uniref:uncharacterized protein n=1 Tax=Coccidioides posadasii (strain RMSCC 757 / Silveira) TaxID=443226 RepID=UPI001BEFFFCF|nr:hypothetical protein D8B26_001365 [Coccidioides posadasii str. Silveira]